MWSIPAATAAQMNSMLAGVCSSLFVPRPILVTSRSPSLIVRAVTPVFYPSATRYRRVRRDARRNRRRLRALESRACERAPDARALHLHRQKRLTAAPLDGGAAGNDGILAPHDRPRHAPAVPALDAHRHPGYGPEPRDGHGRRTRRTEHLRPGRLRR